MPFFEPEHLNRQPPLNESLELRFPLGFPHRPFLFWQNVVLTQTRDPDPDPRTWTRPGPVSLASSVRRLRQVWHSSAQNDNKLGLPLPRSHPSNAVRTRRKGHLKLRTSTPSTGNKQYPTLGQLLSKGGGAQTHGPGISDPVTPETLNVPQFCSRALNSSELPLPLNALPGCS